MPFLAWCLTPRTAGAGPGAIRGVVMDRLPIDYVRGYAGPTAGIDIAVDDPFRGLGREATHVRASGDAHPMSGQFRGVGRRKRAGSWTSASRICPRRSSTPKPLAGQACGVIKDLTEEENPCGCNPEDRSRSGRRWRKQ